MIANCKQPICDAAGAVNHRLRQPVTSLVTAGWSSWPPRDKLPRVLGALVKVIIQPDEATASRWAATSIAQGLRANPRLVLGLAAGRTMEAVYARLAEMHRDQGLDFSACHTFNLDEYLGLAESDCNSFRHYMDQHLFSRVNIGRQNAHVPDGAAADLDAECADYERLIVECGGIDIQLLGVGLNGHIGFNEPPCDLHSRTHVQVLSPMTRRQNSPLFSHPDQVPRQAITLGVSTILDCRLCLVLATGAGKAEIVAKSLEGPVTKVVPASALQMHPHCTAILDAASARRLKNTATAGNAQSVVTK